MRIAIMSDLHLEFDRNGTGFIPSALDADLVILAGDIHTRARTFDWIKRHFLIPAIYVLGNHEFYGSEIFETISLNRTNSAEGDGRTVFLECGVHVFELSSGERARVIGATLWADFSLYGTRAQSMTFAEYTLTDFSTIKIRNEDNVRALTPFDTLQFHLDSVSFLEDILSKKFDGVTIVVTHHAPTSSSIAQRFEGDLLSPAFASNLETLIHRYQPDLWVHGHVHDSFDCLIGATRVVCNPRGYFPDELNSEFDPALVIELRKN
jgi:Icc-related predicted phosphoesterase